MSMTAALAARLVSCGPTLNGAAGTRAMESLVHAAERDGWAAMLAHAEAALRPVFAASPYLAGLAVRAPRRLRQALEAEPEVRLADILAETKWAANQSADLGDAKHRLRELKAQTHLLTALADLGGVWDLD
jgi:glutamate-ammonia-ligase adenylyltransferase